MKSLTLKPAIFRFYQKFYADHLLAFKNKHQGQDCYIFGDGVSIKWFSLPQFADKISITVGFIPFHKSFKSLNAKYCIVSEPYWFYNKYVDKLITAKHYPQPEISSAYKAFIRTSAEINFFISFTNLFALRSSNINYLFQSLPCNDAYNKAMKNINYFNGSFRTSISLAIYMGFANIFLVGFDYTHLPSLDMHWYENGKGKKGFHAGYQQDFLLNASSFASIYTITPFDSKSEYIKSISYCDFTGTSQHYQENTDLLDTSFLSALDTYPGYNIF